MRAEPATAAARRAGVWCSTEAIGDGFRCRRADRPERGAVPARAAWLGRAAWPTRAAWLGRVVWLGRAVSLRREDEDRDGFRCCADARGTIEPSIGRDDRARLSPGMLAWS